MAGKEKKKKKILQDRESEAIAADVTSILLKETWSNKAKQ